MKITHEKGVAGWVTKVVTKVNGFPCVHTLQGQLTEEQAIERMAAGQPREPANA